MFVVFHIWEATRADCPGQRLGYLFAQVCVYLSREDDKYCGFINECC